MIQADLKEVEEILRSQIGYLIDEYKIRLLYVFGSYATGKNNRNSDLDIAVLLEDGYIPMVKLHLLGDLNTLFNRDDIDLVILNNASPVLKFQVIKYGKKLYVKDDIDKIIFEARVMSEYMDMEPFRRRQTEIINMKMEHLFKGGFLDDRRHEGNNQA